MYEHDYISFLAHFHGSRDYFECHEILEEHWKKVPPLDRKKVWVGLIQVAVALYHQRRHNFQGAKKMLISAISILRQNKDDVLMLGLDHGALMQLLQQRLLDINSKHPYESLQLPISDQDLIRLCINECNNHGWKWQAPSDLNNNYILNKHTLRDRSDVIAERNQSLLNRKNN